MDELLAKVMQGVDPATPGAFWQMLGNLMAVMPWVALIWWNIGFIAVGAALGWWRGRLVQGIVWSALLGPVGWFLLLRRQSTPPPLPPRR